MAILDATRRCLILAGLLLLVVGIPFPQSILKTSLTSARPSYRTTHQLPAQQPNAESAAGRLSESYRTAWPARHLVLFFPCITT
jgi:hypothetical protein